MVIMIALAGASALVSLGLKETNPAVLRGRGVMAGEFA